MQHENQALKNLFSLVYILRGAPQTRGGPLLCAWQRYYCRVEFFFLRPLLKGYLYICDYLHPVAQLNGR